MDQVAYSKICLVVLRNSIIQRYRITEFGSFQWFGSNATAFRSVALGDNTTASGENAFSGGVGSQATFSNSFSFGLNNQSTNLRWTSDCNKENGKAVNKLYLTKKGRNSYVPFNFNYLNQRSSIEPATCNGPKSQQPATS